MRLNGSPLHLAEPAILRLKILEPILLLGRDKFAGVDMRIRCTGGGFSSQVYAIRQAIAKSMVAFTQKCECSSARARARASPDVYSGEGVRERASARTGPPGQPRCGGLARPAARQSEGRDEEGARRPRAPRDGWGGRAATSTSLGAPDDPRQRPRVPVLLMLLSLRSGVFARQRDRLVVASPLAGSLKDRPREPRAHMEPRQRLRGGRAAGGGGGRSLLLASLSRTP